MDAVRTAQYMDVEIVATNRTVAHSTEMVCSGVVNRRILHAGKPFVLKVYLFILQKGC